MAELAHAALGGWESFYVIVGSSGAALIGLQFVVITLVAERRSASESESIGAFGTPTVVHLGGALLISAIMSAPWPSLLAVALALAACGVAGVLYEATVVDRARRQTSYRPDREDWAWYIILPTCAFVVLALAALFLPTKTGGALFVIAGVALGLLLIAIHNAWDTVTYIAVSNPTGDRTNGE
ncbi:MAG TPA: hypothetical protein VFJ96_03270 [Gemmatimonadaceae bacterium]|jgi:hypothetical protein|nr:hypothetical protein [Gemmatimonadaceae bacterium]